MSHRTESYRSYLLRLRCVDNGGRALWLYTLESPDGSERHEFRTAQALMEFLARQTPPCGAICRWWGESRSSHGGTVE